jgi:hypothetical protein
MLASSLDGQGLGAQASKVRREIVAAAVVPVRDSSQGTLAADKALQAAASALVASAGEKPAPPRISRQPVRAFVAAGPSVTVTLPPASAAHRSGVAEPARRANAAAKAAAARTSSPRLERLSTGEVALVTLGGPLWRRERIAATAHSTTVRFVPLRPAPAQRQVRLLNAARVDRLAARTRAWLTTRGWGRIAIGDAAAVRPRSLILYPAGERALAQRLSAHLGFAIAERTSTPYVTVVLGKDAARLPRS